MYRVMREKCGAVGLTALGRKKIPCVSPGMGEMKRELRELKGTGERWRMKIMGNEHKTATDSERKTDKDPDKRETSSCTCASGKATSMMLGWPRGSPFSRREKMTW